MNDSLKIVNNTQECGREGDLDSSSEPVMSRKQKSPKAPKKAELLEHVRLLQEVLAGKNTVRTSIPLMQLPSPATTLLSPPLKIIPVKTEESVIYKNAMVVALLEL
jgi:hypothetical protein